MMRRAPWALAALVVLLLTAASARADFVDYSYRWSITPGSVIASGTGSVLFALAPDGNLAAERGTITPVLGAWVTTSRSASSPPDDFDVPFQLRLELTDTASGASGMVNFHGTITGTLTNTTSTLTIQFASAVTVVETLGENTFRVSIDPVIANLPFPGSEAPVLLDALITVTRTRDAESPSSAPEPTALVLAASGIGLLSVACRRRQRSR